MMERVTRSSTKVKPTEFLVASCKWLGFKKFFKLVIPTVVEVSLSEALLGIKYFKKERLPVLLFL